MKIESKMTDLKYLSVDNNTWTPGVARKIKGIENDKILITSTDWRYSGKSILIISGRINKYPKNITIPKKPINLRDLK